MTASDGSDTAGQAAPAQRQVEALVIGLGFAGLSAVHQLRERGVDVHALDAAGGPGGIWYWNRYPGARCDVQSLWYSYGFSDELQQEWEWSEKYARQPEILRYAEHVTDRFDLRRDCTFSTRVTAAEFDAGADRWEVVTDTGTRIRARFLVTATGCLSSSRIPELTNADAFRGRTFHTGQWPHQPVDFTGRRVGVIGTGSSGIQIIPMLAAVADRLTVFQRTANFSIPARNRPYTPEEQRSVKADYPGIRVAQRRSHAGALHSGTGRSVLDVTQEQLAIELESRWEAGGTAFMGSFTDILSDDRANHLVAEFARDKIRRIVTDPETAEKLVPRGHPIGAKRICVDDHYFETFNRDNVDLVDVNAEALSGFTENGLCAGSREIALDDVVFATGYDAMTGALTRMGIRGRDGLSLEQAWRAGPRSYLGIAVHGFPNLFIAAGPGSPSVMVNGVMAGEQHAEWIADAIAFLGANGISRIEARRADQDAWVQHVNDVAAKTLFPKANSWYMGANVPGKPRVFMPYTGGFNNYVDTCARVAADGYAGFDLSAQSTGAAAARLRGSR
ncbi:flavin-containing monooxygenase [Nakamurella lactea]|uniref:flavin-containing monooxygenase n=1 Tax=Nakamurella lactea TaxID=459515 RepID=UPI0004031D5D|nr:NAD(P)/FAD-dependent oxidoreductase [Nakamurella lactea]